MPFFNDHQYWSDDQARQPSQPPHPWLWAKRLQQDLRPPGTYANTLTQEMVHEPAHLWRKEVERLAEEAMFVEKTTTANLPILSTAWPTQCATLLYQCHSCWGIIAYCGLFWIGRRGRKVFPVWPSKEIWDALFLRICIKILSWRR